MYKEIDFLELEKKIHNNEDIELIDVREKNEWDMIKIPKAKLIPLSSIQSKINDIDFSKPVYIFCRTGTRSWHVCHWIDSIWKKVTNIDWSIKQLYDKKSDIIEISNTFNPWYF